MSLRPLFRQPTFFIPALLTIVLGIGVTTAVFSLLYAVLLRPFPYGDPDRLVRVFTVMSKENDAERNVSLLDIEDYNRRSKLMEDFGAYTTFDTQLEDDGAAQAVVVAQLNQEALRALQVAPAAGRLFTPQEDRKGGPVHKAILSYALWQSRYGGDPSIVGRVIRTPMTGLEVVGVMPAGFRFPDRSDLWLPMESWYALGVDRYANKQRDQRWYATVARLKPGVTMEQAQAEMNEIARQLAAEYPKEDAGVGVRLRTFRDAAVGSMQSYLWLLAGGVAIVLLIAVVNVANLFVARVIAQQRQYVIQAALGASRWMLARGLLLESLTISLAGAAVGTVVAAAAIEGFQTQLPPDLPTWIQVDLNPAVLSFGVLVAVVSGALMGLAPAWIGSRVNLEGALRENARGNTGTARLQSAFIVAEVTLSVLLLVGAGLLLKTFFRLQQADHGFAAENLIVARISNSRFHTGTRADRARRLAAYHADVREQLTSIPGVSEVALTNSLPYSGAETRRGRLRIQGRSDDELRFLLPVSGADVHWDYFRTMKIPLLSGRFFERSDGPDATPVVIINETAARTLFPEQDPVGRMIQWGDTVGPSNPYCRIVGVVKDVRWEATERSNIELYYPFTQWPVATGLYLFRTTLSVNDLAPQMRTVLRQADDRAAVVWVKSMEDRIEEALWQRRLWGLVFTVFAALALVLAAVGLYGVLAYSVAQRRREIGIRLAIGSTAGGVRSLVVGQGMRLIGLGLLLGAMVSVVAVRLLASLVETEVMRDWTVYAGVAAVLAVTGLAACLVPALRASRVDPLIALRDD